MNKKIAAEIAVGIILVIAIIIGGFIWLENERQTRNQPIALSPANKTEKLSNKDVSSEAKKIPEQVTREYYESFINYLNKKNISDNTLNPDFVTERIIKSYEKLVNSPGNLSYNPFLCAQNYPDDASKLDIVLVEKKSASAKLKVTIFTDWPPISVTLLNDKGTWKINEIVCSNGSKL